MMMFDLGLLSVCIVLIVFAVSMAIGKGVQATTHFLWPHDVISILIISVSAGDILYRLVAGVEALPFHPYMWMFVWIGYFGGFITASRHDYVHILNIRAALSDAISLEDMEKNSWMRKFIKKKGAGIFMPYIVPYQIGTTWYIRPQTNRDLLKDWIWGIKCDVDTNASLKPSMDFNSAHPFFPMPKIAFLPVEVFNTDVEIIRKNKRIQCKHCTVTILVSPLGMSNSLDVLFNHLLAHQRDIVAVHKAQKEKLKAELDIPRVVSDQLVKTITSACLDSAPGVMLYQNAKALERAENKPQEPPDLQRIRKTLFRNRGGR